MSSITDAHHQHLLYVYRGLVLKFYNAHTGDYLRHRDDEQLWQMSSREQLKDNSSLREAIKHSVA